MAEHNDIELRSDKVRNIIGNIPPLLIRGGITFITILVFGLLLAGWFIPYPENLKVPVSITPLTHSIIPNKSPWQATASLPYTLISKITEGMTVQVEIEGYPARIYGYYSGLVTHINKTILNQNGQNYFSITITPSDSQTIQNDGIEIQEGMNGHAFILLSDKSIIKHILRGVL